jgi:hypothetical protein
MSRIITVGAAQMGPVRRADSRASVVARMMAHLELAECLDQSGAATRSRHVF